LSESLQALRANGSAALDICGVACGRLDMYMETTGICCWDVCAGSVIAEEAGGVAVDPLSEGDLKPFDLMARRIIVANSNQLASRAVGFIKNREVPQNTGSPPTY
jgi:inositol-phosphate phosphatase/L-galactose 1-phosphate phosphatase